MHIFDFELSDQEIADLDALDECQCFGPSSRDRSSHSIPQILSPTGTRLTLLEAQQNAP